MSGEEYTAVEIVDNMSGEYTTSLHRRRKNDLKTGLSGFDEEEDDLGPFDIFRTKSASVDRFRRWRQAALVLNASRRYRYNLDLKKEEEKKQIISKIRTHAHVIREAYLFQVAGQQVSVILEAAAPKLPAPVRVPLGDHGSGPEQLWSMTRDHDFSALQNYGGVNGLADYLPPKVASLLSEGIAQNTTGSVFMSEGGEVEFSGSPITEAAILQWGVDPDYDVHVHWKGAAEIVLACYTSCWIFFLVFVNYFK